MLWGQLDNGRGSALHVGLDSPQCSGKVTAAQAITRESADAGTGGPETIRGTGPVPAKRKRLPGGVEGPCQGGWQGSNSTNLLSLFQ